MARNTKSRASMHRTMKNMVGRINARQPNAAAPIKRSAAPEPTPVVVEVPVLEPAASKPQQVTVTAPVRQRSARPPVQPLAVRRPIGTSNIYSGAVGLKQFR